ncbi:MAG: thioredoxin domain-containing protein [Isosphaeraceae bacterium]|nr:thioredoxin domain-containing protein [Isosphaeraceae bacterium]
MSDASHPAGRPANRLAGETSPYLLQHRHNPVDWFPWGPEALEKAKAEDKPIFLSIGYSACHWCHVMERESFENDSIAALMNEHFINIKVDREERPDLDNIYMAAVQAITGHGGWPMSVFLTPDLQPFFGGTYYPPVDSRGMPGFPRVLLGVSRAWAERRDEIEASAASMTDQLRSIGEVPPAPDAKLSADLLDHAARSLARAFDGTHGGFGSAPKFPHPMDLRMLLRHHARTGDAHSLRMVRLTLEKMARGGIHDHLAGGFARYSTDERWLAPHFEKMLYDNALLASTYLEAYQVTRDPFLAGVARTTLDYVVDRMTDPVGAFHSTEDADSEGVEGKYYVWSLAEVERILGPERAKTFAFVYDVDAHGNWEETNILNLPRPIAQAAEALGRTTADLETELAAGRAALLAERDLRIPPGKDTKILTSWNGLMLAPLAEGSRILGEQRWLDAARKAASFLVETMIGPDGRLLHSFKDGRARFNAYLDDYANLIDGLTRVYEACGDPAPLEAACRLADVMIDEFADTEKGGFFYTGHGHERLIVRAKDIYDNATPSASSMASLALIRLGTITERARYVELGTAALEAIHVVLERAPSAAGQSLIAVDFLLGPIEEFVVVAEPGDNEFRGVLETISSRFLPRKVVIPARRGEAEAPIALVPLLEGRPPRDGRATTYICEGRTCRAPVVGVAGVLSALG